MQTVTISWGRGGRGESRKWDGRSVGGLVSIFFVCGVGVGGVGREGGKEGVGRGTRLPLRD